jgi:hypothetical protein
MSHLAGLWALVVVLAAIVGCGGKSTPSQPTVLTADSSSSDDS